MRRLALLLLALGLAAPASAQIAGRHDYGDVRTPDRLGSDGRVPGPSPAREARALRGDIRDLRESGALSRQEARRMSREARAKGRSGSGLSAGAARAATAQLLALRSQIHAAQARPDRPRRGGR
jgi:hypothetical protein